MSEWKPISTAPKDGLYIVITKEGGCFMSFQQSGRWVTGFATGLHEGVPYFNCVMEIYPTHWMDLPEPPND